MRWFREEHEHQQTRQREGFLWLPLQIGRETRWLERARWEQAFDVDADFDESDWIDVRWLP